MPDNTYLDTTRLNISAARQEDLSCIKDKIIKYLLDGSNIDYRQFFVLRRKDKILAFGRIIEKTGYFEIASLGVDYYHRRRGLGIKMLEFLVSEAKRRNKDKPIYGVTHRPEFLCRAGFVEVQEYPAYLGYKKNHLCRWDGSRIKVMQFSMKKGKTN